PRLNEDIAMVVRVVQSIGAEHSEDIAAEAPAVGEDKVILPVAAPERGNRIEGNGSLDHIALEGSRVIPGNLPRIGRGRAYENVRASSAVDNHGSARRGALDGNGLGAAVGVDYQFVPTIVVDVAGAETPHSRARDEVLVD